MAAGFVLHVIGKVASAAISILADPSVAFGK
jgi:hypothetical protein